MVANRLRAACQNAQLVRLPLPNLGRLQLGNNRNRLGDPKGGAPAQLVAGWVGDQHLVSTRVIQAHTADGESQCCGTGNLFSVFEPLIAQWLGAGRLDLESDTSAGGHHSILRFSHKGDRHVDDHLGFITGDGTPFVGNRDRVRPALSGLDIRNLNLRTCELVEHLPVSFPLKTQRLRAACGNNQGDGLSLAQHIASGLGRDDRRLQNQQTHLWTGHLAGRVAGHHAVFTGVRLLHVVENERLFGGSAQGLVFVQPLVVDRLGAGG